ncbi:MAG: HAMP domain-containing protein [Proteobacteria bacterium]|nr:HAMP domain-containing protein [Pseudomonadota bacterium]
MSGPASRPRSSLFAKYFRTLFVAVAAPLIIAGGSEAWLGYHDERQRLNDLLTAEARLAAVKIENFLDGIREQLGWVVHLPWSPEDGARRRLDALRLLRQVPAIESLTLVDGTGRERLYVSRIGLNRLDSGIDRADQPAVQGARSRAGAGGVWFGPVNFHDGSEPFMTIAVAGNRSAIGVAVAEVNLKFIWDVVSAIQVGRTGDALVLDQPGRLVAHPDIDLVLRADDTAQRRFQDLRETVRARPGAAETGRDANGATVLAAIAPVPGVDWTVVVKQPLAEAFGPLFAALGRTALLLVAGIALAAGLAWALAQRMIGPIRVLEDGVARIGAGHFEHRIEIATGDEFERLSGRFNEMAAELAEGQERVARIGRLRRFLAPQVAELVDRTGDESVLDGRRVEVVVLFCDLRGFTGFSARADTASVLALLRDYYDALEHVANAHAATLTNFLGDGAMVLVNAPVPCPEPALQAATMAVEMQASVQALLASWRTAETPLGFGIGLAMGPATVGRIGAEGRLDYTAVGTVVNLASRLCAEAGDGDILLDRAAAEAIGSRLPLAALEARTLKGFDDPVPIHALSRS